jgi:hypothetical protein
MNKQSQGVGQGLAGTEPYGAVEGARLIGSIRADVHGKGVEVAPPSGIAYGGVHYKNGLCQAMTIKEEQCKAPKAKNTDYCIGHLNSLKKMGEEQDAALDPKE